MSKILAAILLVLVAVNAQAQALDPDTDGYTSRACGFDMDDDGTPGEPEDCNVCDGTTTDPDGDEDTEDQVYVDCNSGSNSANCGTVASPCRSISYALGSTSGSTNTNNRADGNGDGAEDIICVRATCAAYNSSSANGLVFSKEGYVDPSDGAYRTKTAADNENFNFRYPRNPAMIVAWDTDNDGSYPPHDSTQSEPFVIDGCLAGSESSCTTTSGIDYAANGIAFGNADNMEFAHVTLKNFGRETTGSAVGVRWLDGGGIANQHYFHDAILQDILRDVESQDGRRVLSFEESGTNGANYVAIENVKWTGTGAWPLRGYNTGGGNVRFSHITEENLRPGSPSAEPFKPWKVTNIEFIDSLFDGTTSTSTNAISGVFFNKGTINGYVTSNTFKNVSQPVHISNMDDDSHGPITNIQVRRNYAYFTAASDQGASFAIVGSALTNGRERSECSQTKNCETTGGTSAKPCGTGGAQGNADCTCSVSPSNVYMTNISITDNIFDGANNNSELDSFVSYQNGSNCSNMDTAESNYGPLTVANNTILNFNPTTGSSTQKAAFLIGRLPSHLSGRDWDWKYVKGNVYIYNNIVTGLGDDDYAVINWKRGNSWTSTNQIAPLDGQTSYAPGTDWFSDRNIFRGSGTQLFRRGTTNYSGLAAWKSATGEDDNSTSSCTPQFESDGYTLLSTDTCARNNANATYCETYDWELDTRSTCDIGADEYVVAGPGDEDECATASDCNDNNPCTNDTCSGVPKVCSHTNNTASCTDNTYCNGADTCSGGTCSVHAGNPCPGADGDSDCSEVCNEATDTCTANDPNGSACDDGLYCTLTDTCTSGTCSGTSSPCAGADGDGDCTETCDETANDCNGDDPDGSACTDGLFCTEPDACSSGTCTGAALDCSASDTSCKTGTCDEGTDACISGANKADGTPCNDGTFCNGPDFCASGDCTTHDGDPCVGGPNPLCNESSDTCYAFTTDGDNGMVCWGCTCQGCSMR